MFFVIILNIIFILWLYKKYVYTPNDANSRSYQEFEGLDSALIGYIENEDGNSIDWILAEVLELNRKGYISIDYVREDVDKYNYVISKIDKKELNKLKKYEITAYRFLFDERDTITMDYLEEKIKRSMQKQKDANVKSLNIRNEIKEELINLEIIDEVSGKRLKKIKKVYIILMLIILFIFRNMPEYQFILFLIETIAVFWIISKGNSLTEKGKLLKAKIKQYKKTLAGNEMLKDKKIVNYILLEKDFTNSIALHITSEAREEFISDELKEATLARTIGKVGYIIFYILIIAAFLSVA